LREPASSHEEQRLLIAHDAIELSRTLDFRGILNQGKIAALPERQPRLNISGVSVSVHPTNSITVAPLGKQDSRFGLVRPYFAKCQPLNTETAALHGALLHWYAEEIFPTLGEAQPSLCFIIDVFAQNIVSAPKNFKQRRKLLGASCQEIADRWPAIRKRLIEEEEVRLRQAFRRTK